MNSDKTLEEIENDYWGDPPGDATGLVKSCFSLRKKKLGDLTTEDLRTLIGQNFSLEHLIPLAIRSLRKNPFAEGDYYEGDLLKSVLSIEKLYWNAHPDLKNEIISMIKSAKFKKILSSLNKGIQKSIEKTINDWGR